MPFAFCPQCSTKLVPTTIEDRELLKCPGEKCSFVHWNSPLTVAVAVIETDAGIVLVQRGIPPVDKWCLPAGFANTGETPAEAAVREAFEESGLIISVAEIPFAIKKVPKGNQNLFFFKALTVSGAMQFGSDAKDVRAFKQDELPDIAFPLHSQVINDIFAAKKAA